MADCKNLSDSRWDIGQGVPLWGTMFYEVILRITFTAVVLVKRIFPISQGATKLDSVTVAG